MTRTAFLSGAASVTAVLAVAGLGALASRAQNAMPAPVARGEMPSDGACSALSTLKLPGVSISDVKSYGSGFVPPADPSVGWGSGETEVKRPICRVSGMIKPTPRSRIRFEVWLPAAGWNGKYNGVGNGGAAGFIAYGAMTDALNRGYATGSTDTGHRGSLLDGSWMFNNPVLVEDFAERSQHLTAQAAKQVVQAYYRRKANHAYFTGCSNGGGQGQMEAQRHPEDYDGIVNGDAARVLTREWPGELHMSWAVRADRQALASKIPALHDAVLAHCDAKDGLKDGLIENPAQCDFDPKMMQCAAGTDSARCLTPGQVAIVRKVYAGLRDPRTGRNFWFGASPGSELGWLPKFKPTSAPLPEDYVRNFVVHDRGWTYLDPKFSFEDPATFDALLAANCRYAKTLDADDPNLTPFAKSGGKIILYQGWADADIAAGNIVDYYHRAVQATGGGLNAAAYAKTGRFARLFMVPGMAHCGGGYGPNSFDALAALEDWVERGKAPDRIEASQLTNKVVTRTRPLCPYPQQAAYLGHGDIDQARNFACRIVKG